MIHGSAPTDLHQTLDVGVAWVERGPEVETLLPEPEPLTTATSWDVTKLEGGRPTAPRDRLTRMMLAISMLWEELVVSEISRVFVKVWKMSGGN